MIVKLVLTITILSVEVTQGENNNLTSILEFKMSFFHKINADIHNAVNKIFNCLRLLKYFSKSDQNEQLLKMHNDFLNIAERNYAMYEDLRNASNTNYTIGDYGRKFLESLNEIVKDETNKHKHARNKTLNNAQNNTKTEKSDDSLEFLDEFVDKFSKLTIENLTNHNNEINETTKNAVVKFLIKTKNYELKAWNSTFLNGIPSNLTRRLYRGRGTRIKNYPFVVSIHIMNDFMCSGSIISKDLVITAASCLQIAYNNHQNPRSVFVRVGSDYTKSYGQLIPVTDVYFHPQYDPLTLGNNIAIVRIKRQLKLSLKKGRIRRIQYNKKVEKQTDGVYVLGWGAQNSKHNPNNLQKLAVDYLDFYSFRDCQEIYTSRYVTDKNFCAGFTEKGAGACNRDVGGPGFRDGTLVGIISFGPPVCGTPNSPTVFTNIGYYATWIDSIVHQKIAFKLAKPIFMTTRSQLRTAKTARSRSLSKKLLHTTSFTTSPLSKKNDDYPEEVNILKDMLQEIVLTNNSIVDYVLYGNTIDKQETTASDIKAYNNNNNFQVYNKKANNKHDFGEYSKTTDMYRDKTIVTKYTTTPNHVHNNKFPVHHRTTKNVRHIHRFVSNSGQLRDVNTLRHKDNYDINADTPSNQVHDVVDGIAMTYGDGDKSSDVSENYENNSDHEHEIAIDTNDIALKNISFLDVIFNLQQYQQSHFPNIQADDKNEKDPINLQLYLGSQSRIDTTPGYLNEISTKIEDVEPEPEENSCSDGNDDDAKQFHSEENDNRIYYPIIDPWQAAFTKDVEKRSIQSQQYGINLQGRNIPESLKYVFGIPRAN